ncbi:putative toxin-antitoxin system toxin component, PIN family [Variovorax dokdonensis]|uniref:Toxin-antitoxin system toxin component, PIN family n=1 Tax=Variovorax dokdonensis TaxID=344883 RepID=A0ABT7NAE0_9BURK|nr:putative toxin-antitoxin system toxin component, PIN family [Variovorax dokdonensis]
MNVDVVLDTNIGLDLLVFEDPACRPLRAALDDGRVRWIATAPMRAEMARVLGYPLIQARLARIERTAQQVLDAFDAQVSQVDVPDPGPAGSPACEDPDDQMFIDLAVAHRAFLLSKDRAVLQLRRQLEACGVPVMTQWPA